MLKNARVELWLYNLSWYLKGIRMFLLTIPEVKLFRVSQENSLDPQTWLPAVARQWGDVAPEVTSQQAKARLLGLMFS